MPRPPKITSRAAQMTAVLRSQGLTQKDVAQLLKVSDATAFRLVTYAVEEGWLNEHPQCNLPPDKVQELKRLIYAPYNVGDGEWLAYIHKTIGGKAYLLQDIQVFDSGEVRRKGDPDDYQRNLREFGSRACEYLHKLLLTNVGSIGVSWGSTLREIIRGLKTCFPPPLYKDPKPRPIFFPICGDPPEISRDTLRSASSLVSALDRVVNGTRDNQHNFTGVAASTHVDFSKDKSTVIREFFSKIEAYKRVFGTWPKRDGIIQQVQGIISSVGIASEKFDPWMAQAAEYYGIGNNNLRDYCLGNISGIYLPRPELDANMKTKIQKINELWTGANIDDFRNCADRAQENGRMGVVVFAVGGDKTSIVRECIRLGIVTRAVVCQEIAAKICNDPPQAMSAAANAGSAGRLRSTN